jgi:putative transposase
LVPVEDFRDARNPDPVDYFNYESVNEQPFIYLGGLKNQVGWVVHSARGSQYAALDYQALLDQHGFLCSMRKKGDCYDNAAMESFFHTLKVEQVHGTRYPTREAAKADVFEYIETYYHPKRRHSTLNYQSPWDFENRMAA